MITAEGSHTDGESKLAARVQVAKARVQDEDQGLLCTPILSAQAPLLAAHWAQEKPSVVGEVLVHKVAIPKLADQALAVVWRPRPADAFEPKLPACPTRPA